MTGLLANLVGAATAALNPRSSEASPPASKGVGSDPSFASALSAALGPRQRNATSAPAERSRPADLDEAEDSVDKTDSRSTAAASASEAAQAAPTGRTADARDANADADAATTEASASEATRGPGPARPPTAKRRGLEGLDPEFRERLERVIARMEGEFGYDVQIVETLRDQARQDYLYAQGRTRPGPVVTWTRDSNHLHGRAADVMIDGRFDHPALKLLARIAREEGLRTLGARDPGHIELPSGARLERLAVSTSGSSALLDGAANRAAEGVRLALSTPEAVAGGAGSGVARVARVATVARVAEVAQPAEVAQVATVARVATPGTPAAGTGNPSVPAPHLAAPAGLAARSGGEQGGASGDGGRREGGTSHAHSAETGSAGSGLDGAALLLASDPGATPGSSGDAGALSAIPGSDAAERIARVLQLQDTPSARALSQVVLRLDNGVGGEDRIRVDLRGSSVGAALEVGDPLAAARLQSELGQLQRALEGKGLRAEHLSVSGLGAHRELMDTLRGALAADTGQRASQDPGGRGDGWGGRSGGGRQQSDSEPRQHPRRHSQQERNT